jgi:hypothetical protein
MVVDEEHQENSVSAQSFQSGNPLRRATRVNSGPNLVHLAEYGERFRTYILSFVGRCRNLFDTARYCFVKIRLDHPGLRSH